MNIEVRIDSNAAKVLDQLTQVPPRMLETLRRTILEQNEYTIGHIRATRLIGKGPFPLEQHRLGQVTSKLTQSLTQTKPQIVGDQVISSIGSPLRYAWAHEFGFVGRVAVPSHERKYPRKRSRTSARTGKLTRGRRRSGSYIVGSHTRQMDVPARAPIYYGLLDRMHEYDRAISQAIVDSWEGKT
jgi:hypothetical protein